MDNNYVDIFLDLADYKDLAGGDHHYRRVPLRRYLLESPRARAVTRSGTREVGSVPAPKPLLNTTRT